MILALQIYTLDRGWPMKKYSMIGHSEGARLYILITPLPPNKFNDSSLLIGTEVDQSHFYFINNHIHCFFRHKICTEHLKIGDWLIVPYWTISSDKSREPPSTSIHFSSHCEFFVTTLF